jgi:hypothetical protein
LEAALFMLDCLALLWLCRMVVKSEREPGKYPDLGIFRYEERHEAPPKGKPKVPPPGPPRAPPHGRQG